MKLIGQSEHHALISDGKNVFISTLPITTDGNGTPQGLRWECSADHYERYKEVYQWAK